ncbi:pro-sigmaK processing inhibitor BofA family protein [Oscillospiraceae bacterium CM]|nr:pro-sigmaK processing inhibitor BofA family protein [Oscillospiraceae bacterium CM]
MTGLQTAGIIIIAVVLVLLLLVIFRKPMKIVFKLLLNTLLGFLALFALNYLGAFIGVSIGINWINAALVGIFGVPGVALILLLKWLTAI